MISFIKLLLSLVTLKHFLPLPKSIEEYSKSFLTCKAQLPSIQIQEASKDKGISGTERLWLLKYLAYLQTRFAEFELLGKRFAPCSYASKKNAERASIH